jgi:hypothetical protein
MTATYFKARKAFNPNPHPFELGNILGLKRGYEDNHFLLKVYDMEEKIFHDYYQYHLQYYLSQENRSEKDFFSHVWHIVSDRIDYFKGQNPFSSKHSLHVSNIMKLKQFLDYLSPKDQWNVRPNDILIKEKDELIAKLRKEVKTLSDFRPQRKIEIYDDYHTTVIDLFQQMQKLKLPNGAPLLRKDMLSPYYKIISNYFSNNKKEITLDTARNYFVGKDDSLKEVKIPEDRQLFVILPKKNG